MSQSKGGKFEYDSAIFEKKSEHERLFVGVVGLRASANMDCDKQQRNKNHQKLGNLN
ncbi:MAG: hypothetical protein AAGA30_00945 [Planctomycetota bacterium]